MLGVRCDLVVEACKFGSKNVEILKLCFELCYLIQKCTNSFYFADCGLSPVIQANITLSIVVVIT